MWRSTALRTTRSSKPRQRGALRSTAGRPPAGHYPAEVQAAGLSIVELQVMLRPPGRNRSCCNAGQLGDALRQLGFVRERRWRDGRSSFRALWRKRQVGARAPATAAAHLALIEDAFR